MELFLENNFMVCFKIMSFLPLKMFVLGNRHPWKREKFLGYSTMKSMKVAVMREMSLPMNLHSQKLSCWMVTITLRMTPV